jgi:CheY-like chemotaxis protein
MASEPRQPDVALRVLVVDDDPDTVDFLAILLRLHGYGVSTALDGPGALQAAEAHWPDVAVLDLLLPGMDGWQVLKGLREKCGERKRPRFVAVTGYGRTEDHARLLADGFDCCLLKGTDPNELLDWLRTMT